MIGTAKKFARVSLTINGDLGAFVRTAVVKHFDLTITVTDLYNGLASDLRGVVISLLWGLTLMADKDPRICKKMPHFSIIDGTTCVNIAVHLMTLDHIFDVLRHQAIRGFRHAHTPS